MKVSGQDAHSWVRLMPDLASFTAACAARGCEFEAGVEDGPLRGWRTAWAVVIDDRGIVRRWSTSGRGADFEGRAFAQFEKWVCAIPVADQGVRHAQAGGL